MTLDAWAGLRKRKPGNQSWKKLVEIAREADQDEWRTRFRDIWLRGDRQGLEQLAATAPIKLLPPGNSICWGMPYLRLARTSPRSPCCKGRWPQYPGDLWLNDSLAGGYLWGLKPPRYDDALRYYAAALAVRPDNYRLHDMVGIILRTKKSWKAAEIAFSRAIDLRPDDPYCRSQRACNYLDMGQLDLAIADFSKAIDLDPRTQGLPRPPQSGHRLSEEGAVGRSHCQVPRGYPTAAEFCLGPLQPRPSVGLKGLTDEAIAAYEDAIRLRPSFAPAHNTLATITE